MHMTYSFKAAKLNSYVFFSESLCIQCHASQRLYHFHPVVHLVQVFSRLVWSPSPAWVWIGL